MGHIAQPSAHRKVFAGAWKVVTILVLALLLALSVARMQPKVLGQSGNLALNKAATASSSETASYTPNLAVDGNTGTRWASAFSDPQWIRVDLGGSYAINRVVLRWEAAYARAYKVELSTDGATYATLYSTTTGDGGVDDLLNLSGTGRYLRVTGTARATTYGYSLWELEAYGAGSTAPTATRTSTAGSTTSVNVAAGKAASGSVAITNPAFITNGDKNTANYAGLDVGRQWVQLDLGQSYGLNRVRLWHYFGDGRSYHDVIVQLSNDASFATRTTVFNNDADNSSGQGAGTQAEYAETSAGRDITFTAVSARYVRLWSNGSSANTYNHYVEVEAYTGSGTVPTATSGPAATATRTRTPTSAPSGNGKIVGGYWPFWPASPIRIRDVPTGYNLIYLFSARPVGGSPGTTGEVYWSAPGDGRGAATNFNADVQYARSVQKRKIIMSVGGAGFGMSFPNRTKSTNFVNSIVGIYNQIGGFDGLDWNTFEADQVPDLAEMQWISLELKRRFGSGFLITAPPAPWNQRDKDFCRAMVAAGAMDYAAPQYYDGPGLATPDYVVTSVDEWVGIVGESHLVVGFGINPGVANYMTVQQAMDAWNRVEARHPAVRGGFVWQIHTDETQGWPFPNQVGPLILQ
jgi:hypothetical protein